MWVLARARRRRRSCRRPSYPIHLRRAAARRRDGRRRAPADGGVDADRRGASSAQPRPRVVIVSFPHNPTTAVVDAASMQRLVDLAREHEFVLVHDFAYADIAFDGHEPPSILAGRRRARGARSSSTR